MQYRLARMRFLKTIRVRNKTGQWVVFTEGEIRTMQEWNRRPGIWCSDADPEVAIFVPFWVLEVVQPIAPGELP